MKVSEHWAKARVEVLSEAGKWLLMEIRGLKEGTILTGTIKANWSRFDFSWDRYGAMLIPGDNCTILEEEKIEYRVSLPSNVNDSKQVSFDELHEVTEFMKKNGGNLEYGASIVNVDNKSENFGKYIVGPFWSDVCDKARITLREHLLKR